MNSGEPLTTIAGLDMHALERLRERYGIEATTWDLKQAVDDVKAGRAVLLGNQRNGAKRYLVNICGKPIKAVIRWVNPDNPLVVTVEPPEAKWPVKTNAAGLERKAWRAVRKKRRKRLTARGK